MSEGIGTKQNAKIVVVGSSNTDMVAMAEHIPAPGETVMGTRFFTAPGGKGANQAVAAARLGARVTMVACAGDDSFGRAAVEGFQAEGIDTRHIALDPDAPSGIALITVDAKGENAITVAPGANARLSPEHVRSAEGAIRDADALLLQLEIPLDAVEAAARIARDAGTLVILNPAPAPDGGLPPELLAITDVLVPNQTEAAGLAGQSGLDAEDAVRALLGAGCRRVVVTLGSRGALAADSDATFAVPSPKVRAVDTTAAGDAFCGALAVALAEGQRFEAAVRFAVKAAALSVTVPGAQPSLPSRRAVEEFTPGG